MGTAGTTVAAGNEGATAPGTKVGGGATPGGAGTTGGAGMIAGAGVDGAIDDSE